MDVSNGLITVAISAATGVSAAALFIWRASASWTHFKTNTENELKNLKAKSEENETAINGTAEDLQQYTESQGKQWQDMNRALGQIEGELRANPRRTRP